jgi:hypothetical protein
MTAARTCTVCGKPMDPKQHGNFHIKNLLRAVAKHAHAECVRREPVKARAEGF